MRAPVPGFSPELLAQIAQGAFRPPQGMQAPGLSGGQRGGGGMGLGEGMAGLGAGLRMMGGKVPGWVPTSSGSEPGRTTGDADLGGYGGFPVDPFGGAGANPVEIFNPSGAASGGGFWPWLKGLF